MGFHGGIRSHKEPRGTGTGSSEPAALLPGAGLPLRGTRAQGSSMPATLAPSTPTNPPGGSGPRMTPCPGPPRVPASLESAKCPHGQRPAPLLRPYWHILLRAPTGALATLGTKVQSPVFSPGGRSLPTSLPCCFLAGQLWAGHPASPDVGFLPGKVGV